MKVASRSQTELEQRPADACGAVVHADIGSYLVLCDIGKGLVPPGADLPVLCQKALPLPEEDACAAAGPVVVLRIALRGPFPEEGVHHACSSAAQAQNVPVAVGVELRSTGLNDAV